MTSGLSYEKLMNGIDGEFFRVDDKRKHFEKLKQGEFNIIGRFTDVLAARKIRQRYNVYMSKKTKQLTSDFSIKITNLETEKGVVFVVAVVKLTDEDKKIKQETMKELQRRFNRN